MMREFLIIVAVFTGLAIAVELAYLHGLAVINKMQFRLPTQKRVVRKKYENTFVGRPELDFDLHVRKVDKIRFGDEV